LSNRRIPNGTYGGVRGRRGNAPPTRLFAQEGETINQISKWIVLIKEIYVEKCLKSKNKYVMVYTGCSLKRTKS
ncbi:hypothetical protein, partial [Ferdinandcohnia sp. SAFN-114]|uniref:hypothetical protein n=1 Tax=Ferdinandcohnia sp. SAFN-114 TaxID=3387275 RepID=UPI003F813649